MIEIGDLGAAYYSRAGYRGYFDMDFNVGRGGRLFLSESNVRRTGGTHVYHLARSFFGEDFLDKSYIISSNSRRLENAPRSFNEALRRLAPVVFNKQTKEGVVLCSASKLAQSEVAFVVFGRDREHAERLEREMEMLLGAELA